MCFVKSDVRSTYDYAHGDEFNLLTVAGMLTALLKCLRIKRSGLLWGGNPCCNQIWLSASIHKRSEQNPWGDRKFK